MHKPIAVPTLFWQESDVEAVEIIVLRAVEEGIKRDRVRITGI